MMQAWADYLDRLRAGEIEPGNSQGAGAGPQPDATPGCGTPTQLPNHATGFAGAVKERVPDEVAPRRE